MTTNQLSDRDADSLSTIRNQVLEMAKKHQRTAFCYIAVTTAVITTIISLLLFMKYSSSSNDLPTPTNWAMALKDPIAHIASIILIIYLSQLLVSFARYHYRVADKLFSQAHGITAVIVSGEMGNLAMFIGAMSFDIEFGKLPNTPTDKILEVMGKVRSAEQAAERK